MWIRAKNAKGNVTLIKTGFADVVYISATDNDTYCVKLEPYDTTKCLGVLWEANLKTATAVVDEIFNRLANGDIAFDLTAWLEEYEEAGE